MSEEFFDNSLCHKHLPIVVKNTPEALPKITEFWKSLNRLFFYQNKGILIIMVLQQGIFYRNHKKKLLSGAFCLLLLLLPLATESIAAEGPLHILREMVYSTDKYTQKSALIRELNIPPEKSFPTREELDAYLAGKVQDLVNLRVFQEVEYRLELIESLDGAEIYRGTITVHGSWTLYPVPYPKYDSNSGFRGGLKIYYDNFLGTLTNFYLGMNIDIRPDGDDWEIPQWTINPRIGNVSLFGQKFALDLTQKYQETSKYDSQKGIYLQRYNNYLTGISLTTRLQMPWKLYYSFTPKISFTYGYKDNNPDGDSAFQQKPLHFSFSHSIGRSQVDWIGNFRRGLSYSLSHSLSFDTDEERDGNLKTSLGASIAGFYPWKIFNPSFQLQGKYSFFNDETTGFGGELRGIRDDSFYGIAGGFLNASVNISVIRWKGVGEAQFQPFFDVGLALRKGVAFDPDLDIKYAAGAEFILYLDIFKSLVAVGRIGVDLSNPDWKDERKYEITITSKLFY